MIFAGIIALNFVALNFFMKFIGNSNAFQWFQRYEYAVLGSADGLFTLAESTRKSCQIIGDAITFICLGLGHFPCPC